MEQLFNGNAVLAWPVAQTGPWSTPQVAAVERDRGGVLRTAPAGLSWHMGGWPGLWGCTKVLVKTQLQNKSKFQHSAAPEGGTCLLNGMWFVSQNVASFKVTFSVRGMFLSLLQLHLTEDTICCSTQPAWHLKCHLNQKAIEHPPPTETDVISKGELPQMKEVADKKAQSQECLQRVL